MDEMEKGYPTDENGQRRYPETPEEAMVMWKVMVDDLPDIDYDQCRETLLKYIGVQIPNDLLRPEGYVKLIGELQGMRSEAMTIRSRVNEHYKMLSMAVKNLQSVFPGMSDKKTVQSREADAETWLIYIQRTLAKYEALRDTSRDAVDHISKTLADVVQQLKSINQYGVPTEMLDTSLAVSISDDWSNSPDLSEIDDELCQ